MKRLKSNRYISTAILLATTATAAAAQDSGRVLEGAGARTRNVPDSTANVKADHNWFVSLLRKIGRRSDEIAADSAAAADSPVDADVVATAAPTTARSFKSRKDSLSWESARSAALKSDGYRITVDLFEKTLRVVDGDDTLLVAPAATAMNATLTFGKQVWRFETPRGVRTVRRKDKDPVWIPPDWHFAEVALEHGLKLTALHRNTVIKLKDGTKLLTKGDEVGIIRPGSTEFEPMILDEHVVFDNTLFIPPQGTKHRVIQGELGHFRLDLGDGYLLHGTPYAKSIGSAVTHGCVRLRDEDIEWLYENVPVGTKVYIY
ncbi:MAG: L,D-transpeptidase [Gemmatimonadota bacterium]